METIYLGLGSNLGDRASYIQQAIDLLKSHEIIIEKVATIIETDPIGGPPQEKYFNTIVKARTHHSPEYLLSVIQNIENRLLRVRTIINSPRTIDIDILLYGNREVHSESLTIPHPRMCERQFVMQPLKEIAPEVFQELIHAHH